MKLGFLVQHFATFLFSFSVWFLNGIRDRFTECCIYNNWNCFVLLMVANTCKSQNMLIPDFFWLFFFSRQSFLYDRLGKIYFNRGTSFLHRRVKTLWLSSSNPLLKHSERTADLMLMNSKTWWICYIFFCGLSFSFWKISLNSSQFAPENYPVHVDF